MKQMPAVLDEVGERVQVFKKKVTGVFKKVLNTFHKVMGKKIDVFKPFADGLFNF